MDPIIGMRSAFSLDGGDFPCNFASLLSWPMDIYLTKCKVISFSALTKHSIVGSHHPTLRVTVYQGFFKARPHLYILHINDHNSYYHGRVEKATFRQQCAWNVTTANKNTSASLHSSTSLTKSQWSLTLPPKSVRPREPDL